MEKDGALAADRDAGPLAEEEPADFASTAGEELEAGADEAHEAGNGAAGAEANGDGERRRRRRGRRGGRRNRRGREGEAPLGSDNGGTLEPELTRSGADFDGGPIAEPAADAVHVPITETYGDMPAPIPDPSSHLRPQAEAQPPQSAAAAEPEVAVPAAPETMVPEPPRRRSTVREPAPVALRDEGSEPAPDFVPPPPLAEPVVSSPAESESSDRPRRSGWWSKRALGKG